MNMIVRALTVCAIWAVIFPMPTLSEDPTQMPWAIGGTGGVYLLVEPGELRIELFKRDRNVLGSRGTAMRAILAGPDREVLADVTIPSTRGSAGAPPGPVQREVLSVQVERPGIYALNLTTRDDRHGLNIEWAIQTNAAGWVVETARGHRDERHREPIVLTDAGRSADVNFLPRTGRFEIEVEGLPADAEPLTLYDEHGEPVARIPATAQRSTSIRQYMGIRSPDRAEGSARFTVPADQRRGNRPWRLHFPQAQALLEIDGLTRWDSGDLYRDHCVWTPRAESWFPWMEHRWLISPYQRTVYAPPGDEGRITFVVHNNGPEPRTVTLDLEFPGQPWPVRFADEDARDVRLNARSRAEIELVFQSPADGQRRVCHVRATPAEAPEVTTYATLTAIGGDGPVGQPLDLPLVLQPYAHENRQFGYLPPYAVDQQVYFDVQNRPFVVSGSTLHRQVDGDWVRTDLRQAVVRTVPEQAAGAWSGSGSKVAFDADNDVYLIGASGGLAALLHSQDGGETFTAYVIPGRESEPRSWDIEQFSGHNVPEGPPPVVRLTRTHRETDPRLRWRSTNDLDLLVSQKTADGRIEFHEPVRLTDAALSSSMHSGIPSMIVSKDAKVHVVWGEATDPDIGRDEIPGVPAYVATYDRATRTLAEPVFMSFGPPPNDGHNTPSITMDSQGYLHVVVGTHGRPFQYLRSLQPNESQGGWTEAIRTSDDDLRQTYVGLVCGADDTLHLVFRLWKSGEAHLDGGLWAALAYQRKPPGQDWHDVKVLVAPPLSEYSIFYHRLTVDRHGALFLSYDYWSTMWFYRNDQRGPVSAGSGRAGRGWGRAVLISPDNGDRWRLW
jgi:hypothetical protein